MSPEFIVLTFVAVGLCLYAVLGGADFGAGVWEFNTGLRGSAKGKKLIYSAIGPVWEANHVWLIFVLMLMWNAFPVAFAAISRLVFFPLLLALVGIVFRGTAYAFRSPASGLPQQQKLWEAVFAIASTAAPFFFGCAVATIASSQPGIAENGKFSGNFYTGWLSGHSLFFGFFAVGICAYVAAIFLTREAAMQNEFELTKTWRTRSLIVGSICGLFAIAGIFVVRDGMPHIYEGLTGSRDVAAIVNPGRIAVSASLLAGFATLLLTATHRHTLAAISVVVTVSSVIVGWGIAQFPMLVIPNITVENAKAPDNVIWLMIAAAVCGSSILVPALVWLMRIFKMEKTTGADA